MRKFWENPANNLTLPEGVKVPDSVRIGGVRIAPATILAPMAGVTDTVFRLCTARKRSCRPRPTRLLPS